jgi:hypothetical protein
MINHECDGCGVESRGTECFCPKCLDDRISAGYDEGYNAARKEFEVKD